MSANNFLRGFKNGMASFGAGIAIIINSMLLAFVYIVGVGIPSLIAKLVGKHFLDMKRSRKITTYWTKFDQQKKEEDDFYKQY